MAIAGFDVLTSIDYQMASARARQAEQERDAALAALDDQQSRDFDETRRLLYMALAAHRTDRYNLVGTLANALAHHRPEAMRSDPIEAVNRLVAAVEGEPNGLAWVRERLAEMDE